MVTPEKTEIRSEFVFTSSKNLAREVKKANSVACIEKNNNHAAIMEELQGIMFIIIRGMLYASGNTYDQLLNCLYHCLCQGNGHEADFDGDEQVYIIDVYNAYIYPGDTKVKGKTLSSYCTDDVWNKKGITLGLQPQLFQNRIFL